MTVIIDYILLLISLAFGTAKNISSKLTGKSFPGISGLMKINVATGILAIAVYCLCGAKFLHLQNIGFMLFALLYGAMTLGSQSFYMLAVKNGSVSVCSLIYASCFMIPTVYSAIFCAEGFSITRSLGIILMLSSIFMVSYKGKSEKGGKVQLLYAFCAMLCAGTVGILQKVFAKNYGKENTDEFLVFSFFFMLLISLAVLIFISFGKKEQPKEKPNKIRYLFALILIVSVVSANKMNMHLASVIPGLVFFPVINGGTIIASSCLSAALFRERLSRCGIAGIAIGLFAMVLIAL